MNKPLLASLFATWLISGALAARAEILAEWREAAFVDGSNAVVMGRQIRDGAGNEHTAFFHADGSPVSSTFNLLHQRRWRAAGDGASGFVAEASARPVVPPAMKHDPIVRPSVAVVLAALDATALRRADALRRDGARARRIGVFRDLPQAVQVGGDSGWLPTSEGGFVHALEVRSTAAEGVRIGIDDAHLPDGVALWVESTDDPSVRQGPYTRADVARIASRRLWTGTIWSGGVTLVCEVPPGVDPSDVSYRVARIVHAYERLASLPRAAGSCHNDVTCQPAWSNEAAAVAGIADVGDDGFLYCTGCLVAPKDASDPDAYFLTANHCVTKQSEADSAEFYWFYQTAVCNGPAPNPVQVPRSGGGADLLASATYFQANDFSFLRLRQQPPGGTFRAGWSVAAPPTSERLAGVHHPDGDYKRISFGNLFGYQSANFWNVRWSSGVTEPGSSGSPLFNAAHQIIGQLYGGNSYCAWKYGSDQYGRFDRTQPVIAKWLAPTMPVSMMFYECPRDYDGDGKGDLNVYHAPASTWYVRRSLLGLTAFGFGYKGTIQVVGDFDGDRRADPCVYDPNNGMWYWVGATGGMRSVQFGFRGTLPVPADFNGDGRTDFAVFDVAKAVWYVASGASYKATQFGFAGVVPVPTDYDGDGRSDIAVFNPSSATWYYVGSTQGFTAIQFGPANSVPVPARYDGDQRIDLATFDSSTGIWHIRGTTNGTSQRAFGGAGTIPVPGSYDGSATAGLATYRLSSGMWSILQGSVTQRIQFGWSEAPPVGVKP